MKVESSKLLDDAKKHYQTELSEAKLPAVLSSIMSTDSLPVEFAGIDEYILTIRYNLEQDAGGELNQLQTICLDSICEVMILVKYIGAFLGQNIGEHLIQYDRAGNPKISDLAMKGFGGFHQILDKKLKLFHELALKAAKGQENDDYIKAVMGGTKPTRGR
jgi:hypothetical protein